MGHVPVTLWRSSPVRFATFTRIHMPAQVVPETYLARGIGPREEAFVTDAARTPGTTPLAWVESPLQLLCAAEFAASLGLRVRVAFRLSGPQMTATAQELLTRGAPFTDAVPYYGVPWGLLADHRDWIIGDAFSGQFRSAMSLLAPRTVTLVDVREDDEWAAGHAPTAVHVPLGDLDPSLVSGR